MINPASPHTRAFLFADLRGYTAYVERHGDSAGRELLRTYRAAVREVIGTFGDTSGLLLCYTSSDGEAVLEWGYDDADVLARAVRADGDRVALLAWWEDIARFGP